MLWLSQLLALAALSFPLRSYCHPLQRQSTLIPNVTIFDPPADFTIPRTLYARTAVLHHSNNLLLTTWENYGPNNDTHPHMLIYASADNGHTWAPHGVAEDQVNRWGLRYQPFLYELPIDIGGYKCGDVLLAANSIPDDLSQTKIDLYGSRDKGKTFNFISSIARGGRAIPNNGETPIWEPFLMMHGCTLIVYYSDQRDPAHGQKLVHQTTEDLHTWTAVVNDVATPNYSDRPGMTTVSKLPNGNYILTYEYGGAPEGDFSVYYKLSPDPLDFQSHEGQVLRSSDGTVPVSSPYNVWTPAAAASGCEEGTIIVSCGTLTQLFVNEELGAPDAWRTIQSPAGISYTRALVVMPEPQDILIVGGGVLNGSANSVKASEIDLTG